MEEQTLKINFSNDIDKPKPKYEKWEIEHAAECLTRAEEIKQNPELMALVAPELEKKLKAQKGIAEILYGSTETNSAPAEKEGKNDK